LQTISAVKGCRLSDLSAQKLQIYLPLRMLAIDASASGAKLVMMTVEERESFAR
jgi:hypothetical protein